MESITLRPASQVTGTIKLPGSKSISNRTLLLAAFANGITEIRDLLASDDTARMLEALEKLGISLEKIGQNDWRVTGNGGQLKVKEADLSEFQELDNFAASFFSEQQTMSIVEEKTAEKEKAVVEKKMVAISVDGASVNMGDTKASKH